MEESGSEGLHDLIHSEVKKGKDGWFNGVDCVCIVREINSRKIFLSSFDVTFSLQSDNYWLNTRTPCLTYGLRGLSYFNLTISGPARDLHSGVFGRVVHEPMTDLVALMSKLVHSTGKILIPGVDEMVAEADAEELFVCLHF
jgi:Cys-Gly metallodipeptidase DUG1